MDRLFEKNLAALRETDAALYEKILACGGGEVGVVESRDGQKIPEILRGDRRVYIHSRYDPVTESRRLVDEAKPEGFNLFIVFGFGFGFHVEEILRRAAGASTVLVLEKNATMVRKALESRSLEKVLQDGRFLLLVEPSEDDLARALRGKSTYRVSFITHRGSFQLDPAYYGNLSRVARSYLSTKEVNIATLAKFEKAWASNIARNIARFALEPGARIFFDRFAGVPVIVAAAGPSLGESIGFMKNNAERAVIVAVDTAYLVLRRHGIEPHFCVCVDPQVVNARYFEGAPEGRTILVADPAVHPSVFRLFRGRCAVSGTAFPMMKWVEEAAGEKGELAYGGSVSTNACDFARRLGGSPVVLLGQDLAFTGGLAHARGAYLDEQMFLRVNRFYTPLMFNRFQLTALPAIHVKGIRSPRVHTNQKMMIFLSWFGKRGGAPLVNATVDGAYIDGVNHVPHDEISFGDAGRDLRSYIDGIYAGDALSGEERVAVRGRLRETTERLRAELNSLLPALERAVTWSSELRSLIDAGGRDQGRLGYILKKLAETDRLIQSKKELKGMIGFTVQRVIHTITEGYEIEEGESSLTEGERTARRSSFLYNGMMEGCTFNRKVLNNMASLLSREL